MAETRVFAIPLHHRFRGITIREGLLLRGEAGWGEWFNHGTGHGVGLQIHETPWLTQSYDDTLQVMDVVTVEPGVYRIASCAACAAEGGGRLERYADDVRPA